MERFLLYFYACFMILSCRNEPATADLDISSNFYTLADSIIYRNETQEFLNFVRSEIDEQTIVLGDKPTPDLGFCLQYVLDDTATFSRDELEEIFIANAHPIFSDWQKISIPDSKIISRDTIVAIFKDENRGWDYLSDRFENGFYDFSLPIFLRDYSYCLFYIGNQCGPFCGYDRLSLYKKEDDKWKLRDNYCIIDI